MVSLKVNYTEEVFETESYKGRGSEEDINNVSVGDGKKKNCKSDRHSKRLCQWSDSVTPSVVYIDTENHRLIGTAIATQTARDSKTESDRESDTDNNNNRRDSLTV